MLAYLSLAHYLHTNSTEFANFSQYGRDNKIRRLIAFTPFKMGSDFPGNDIDAYKLRLGSCPRQHL